MNVAVEELVVVRDGPGWWAGRCVGEPGVFVVGRRRGEVLELLRGLVAGLRVEDGGKNADERGCTRIRSGTTCGLFLRGGVGGRG